MEGSPRLVSEVSVVPGFSDVSASQFSEMYQRVRHLSLASCLPATAPPPPGLYAEFYHPPGFTPAFAMVGSADGPLRQPLLLRSESWYAGGTLPDLRDLQAIK